MATIYEYEITCNVHGLVNGHTHPELSGGGIFGTTTPTACPLGNTDTVLGSRVMNIFQNNEIKILEEDIPTQGYMEVLGYTFNIPSGNTGDITRLYIPIEDNINVYEVNILCEEENKNDTFDMYVGPTTPIGVLTQNLNIGDQYAYLTSIAMTLYKPGFTLAVKHGADAITPIGRILEVDTANSRVKLRQVSAVAMSAGDYLFLWVTRATACPLTTTSITLGNGKIGGSYVNKGMVVTVLYKNNSTEAKKFKVLVENTY